MAGKGAERGLDCLAAMQTWQRTGRDDQQIYVAPSVRGAFGIRARQIDTLRIAERDDTPDDPERMSFSYRIMRLDTPQSSPGRPGRRLYLLINIHKMVK